jgi:hypothetical protein
MNAWLSTASALRGLTRGRQQHFGRTFRLCPEPETAVFKGGNVNKASNWTCGTQRDFLKVKWIPGAKAK